jgi:hypothetical protein
MVSVCLNKIFKIQMHCKYGAAEIRQIDLAKGAAAPMFAMEMQTNLQKKIKM